MLSFFTLRERASERHGLQNRRCPVRSRGAIPLSRQGRNCGRSIKVNVPGCESGEEGALPSDHPIEEVRSEKVECRSQKEKRGGWDAAFSRADSFADRATFRSVAQRAERRFHKPQVVRASRTGATFYLHRVIRLTAKDAALPTRRRRGGTGMAHVFFFPP